MLLPEQSAPLMAAATDDDERAVAQWLASHWINVNVRQVYGCQPVADGDVGAQPPLGGSGMPADRAGPQSVAADAVALEPRTCNDGAAAYAAVAKPADPPGLPEHPEHAPEPARRHREEAPSGRPPKQLKRKHHGAKSSDR